MTGDVAATPAAAALDGLPVVEAPAPFDVEPGKIAPAPDDDDALVPATGGTTVFDACSAALTVAVGEPAAVAEPAAVSVLVVVVATR